MTRKMKIYIDLLLVAVVTIYIVDVSGVTDSWRHGLQRMLKLRSLRPLPPFDCGKCMAWWMCLAYALLTGNLSLPTIAFSALMSLLSIPIGQGLIFIREWLNWIIDKLMPRL